MRISLSPVRIVTSLMFFANGCAFSTWASRIPTVQRNLQLSSFLLGVALLMMGLGALAGTRLIAPLIARLGSHRVTATACLCTAACLLAISFAHNVYQLGAALFAFGLFSGGMDVSMNANAVAVERLAKRPIMASFHAFWSIGSMCGALVGGIIAHTGWGLFQHFAVVSCAVTLFGVVAMRWLLSDKYDGHQPDETEHGATPARSATHQALPLLAMVCLLAFVSEGAVADWSALYMVRGLHTDTGLATLGLASFSAAMTLGRLIGDNFIQRYGDVKVLAVGSVTTAVAILVVTVPNVWITALIGFFLCGIGLSSQVPIAFRVAGQIRPDHPGAAIAVVARAGYLGLLIGPPVLGFIADALGLRFSLLLIAMLAVLTLICSTRLNHDLY